MDKREWLLKRNCCLTPRQLGMAYCVLVILSCVVAALCAIAGLWQVALFTLLELVAVAAAFLVYARHASDCEHIELSPGCLLIEQYDGEQVRQVRLDPMAARIGIPLRYQDLIQVEARGVRVEVGRHVTASRRRQIARELQMCVPSLSGWHS